METMEELTGRMESAEELHSVVKTMKALAAVSIRQYEQAAESLQEYFRTVELGLRAVLMSGSGSAVTAKKSLAERVGVLAFGSDQGMCGSLNEQVADNVGEVLEELGTERKTISVAAMGERLAGLLEDAELAPERVFTVPGSAEAIAATVQSMMVALQEWIDERGLDRVYLFHSRPGEGASSEPVHVRLLPLDREWLDSLRAKKWPTKNIPMFTMDAGRLFSALVRQYLFVGVFRAVADSLASENSARLASMQGAEKNIEETLSELTERYHSKRQMLITEELLDIVSGFEALSSER